MIAFNAWYYSFSPEAALWINENGWVKPFLRGALTPLLSALTVTAYIHYVFNVYPEVAAVLAGIAASALIGIAYLSPPLVVAYITLNRKTRRLNGWLKTLILAFGLSVLVTFARFLRYDPR